MPATMWVGDEKRESKDQDRGDENSRQRKKYGKLIAR